MTENDRRLIIKLRESKVRKFFLILLFIIPTLLFAAKTNVKLIQGGNEKFRANIEETLTTVLNSVNRYHETNKDLNNIGNYFVKGAYEEFLVLILKTNMYITEKEYKTNLLSTQDNTFEVRNIKVKVKSGKTKGVPFQNLVFVLNKDGKIINTHFSIERHLYENIMAEGKKLKDIAFREKILNFIELYRTAYNKKDYTFIEKTLSDDALIIVGHVIKTQKSDINYLNSSYLSSEKIEFIRLSKNEYLKRLKKVFKKNDFMRILFDEITIQRHPQFKKIYGVQLKQRWHSSIYSDEGYLFLMIDFIEPQEPIIHVRAWQPEKFTDGSTINIYDFEIIE